MRRGNNNRTREMSRRNESRIRELGSDPGKVAFLRNKPWQQPLTRFAIWDVRGPNEQSFVNDGKFVRFLKIEVNEILKLSLPKFDLRTKNNLSQIVFADYTADKLLRTKLQGYWNISFILSSEKETHCSLGICLSSGKRLTLKYCTVIEHLLPSLPPPPSPPITQVLSSLLDLSIMR